MKKAIIVFLELLLLLTLVPLATPAHAKFSPPPSFSVATNNNLAGATNAAYTFTLGNLDRTGDFISEVKITVPAGYTGAYASWGPGKLLGSVTVDGVAFEITSTGELTAVVEAVVGPLRVNVGDVSLNWRTRELLLHVTYNYGTAVVQAVLDTVPGLFVNPQTPGNYIWKAWAKGRAAGSRFQQLPAQHVAIVAPAGLEMHVERSYITSTRVRWGASFVQGWVTINDKSDNPLSRVLVTAQWSGIMSGTRSASTNSSGVASFSGLLFNKHGLLTLTVLKATKAGYTLTNPGMSASITIP